MITDAIERQALRGQSFLRSYYSALQHISIHLPMLRRRDKISTCLASNTIIVPVDKAGLRNRAWCDGQPYADGTYWRQAVDTIYTPKFTLTCLGNPGSPFPPPGAPGGCGGAA
jgi:hypothetical protein